MDNGYQIHTWSDKAFKGTVVNRELLSLHGGSLEITLTVPLSIKFPNPKWEFEVQEEKQKTCDGFKYILTEGLICPLNGLRKNEYTDPSDNEM